MSHRDRYPTPQPRCRRCGADVAPDARFCAECGSAVPSLVELHPADPHAGRMPPWLMPAGVVFGGLAAILAGVFIALAVSGPDEVAGASPTPSPSPEATGPELTPALSPASLQPSVAPVPLPIIPNRAIVAVTDAGGGLQLRSAPTRSAEVLATLSAGEGLFTIGAPEQAEDLRWYRVAIVEGANTGAEGIGWVASPVTGEPWLARVELACGTPTTVEELGALAPLERLACFGRDNLTIIGAEVIGATGCHPGGLTFTPLWLASPCGYYLGTLSGTTHVSFRVPDAVGPLLPSGLYRLLGHLEDPAAASCRAVDDPEISGPPEWPAPSVAALVLQCRTQFVVTDIEPMS